MPLDKPRCFRENKKKQKEFNHKIGVCAISCACFCFFFLVGLSLNYLFSCETCLRENAFHFLTCHCCYYY